MKLLKQLLSCQFVKVLLIGFVRGQLIIIQVFLNVFSDFLLLQIWLSFMVRKAREVLIEHCEDWYGEEVGLVLLVVFVLNKPVYAECFHFHLCNCFLDEDISFMSCNLIAILVYLNSIVVNNSNQEHNKLVQANLSDFLGTKLFLNIISHLSFHLFKTLDFFQR